MGYLDNPKAQYLMDAFGNANAYADASSSHDASHAIALLMHVKSVLYASQHLTDGEVPPGAIMRAVGGGPEHVDALVEVGLWHRRGHDCDTCPQPSGKGVYVHDYLEHNRSKAEATGRNPRSEAARKAAQARWSKDASRNAERNANAYADAMPREKREERRENKESSGFSEPADDLRSDPNDRDDVRALLDHLDQKIQLYDPDARLPSRTKTNADAARLLLDRDGRSVEQVKAAIDYSQDTEFWRPNIRSMSKLRTKYETLRAQAMQDRSGRPSQPRQTAWDRELQVSKERHDRMQSGELSFTPIDRDDPDLWMPKTIEE